jgi:hypothetical protein
MITTEINNNSDSFEEDNKVEDDIKKKKTFGVIFIEGDEKKKSCLSAIYVDFSKYLSPEEPRVIIAKKTRGRVFSNGGV